MTKLNQILAIEKGVRADTTRVVTDVHRAVQMVDRLSGISRTYQPRDDQGEELPPESTRVQFNVEDANDLVAKKLGRLFDVVATKDWANTEARGTVKVDGEEWFKAPPTFLLFLEKQLQDIRTYVTKLPTLDPAFDWENDSVSGVYRTPPVKTTKTRKVPHNHVMYEATPEHPAQVTVFNVDEVVGDWTTVKFSGAVTEERRRELLDRVDKLTEAVKFAREEANGHAVTDQEVGGMVFQYLFAP